MMYGSYYLGEQGKVNNTSYSHTNIILALAPAILGRMICDVAYPERELEGVIINDNRTSLPVYGSRPFCNRSVNRKDGVNLVWGEKVDSTFHV